MRGYLAKDDLVDTICWYCNLLGQERAQYLAKILGLTWSQLPDIREFCNTSWLSRATEDQAGRRRK